MYNFLHSYMFSFSAALFPTLAGSVVFFVLLVVIFVIIRKVYKSSHVPTDQRIPMNFRSIESEQNWTPRPSAPVSTAGLFDRAPSGSPNQPPPPLPPDGITWSHDPPPSYDSIVENQPGRMTSAGGLPPTESPATSVLSGANTDHQESPANQQTHGRLTLPQTGSYVSSDIPPTYESYIAMQHRQTETWHLFKCQYFVLLLILTSWVPGLPIVTPIHSQIDEIGTQIIHVSLT